MFTVICFYNKSYKIYCMDDLIDAMNIIGDNYTEDILESYVFCDGVLVLKTMLK